MSFSHRPLDAVTAWYHWGEGDLEGFDGPDKWQQRVLARIQRRLQQGVSPIRIGARAGHGVGKSAMIAWLIHWFASTRPNPQIVVTANTKNQLDTKTWRELARWKPRVINGDWFEWSATRYKLKGCEDTWYASAIPWSKHNPQAFAGTHERHVMVILDEASEIAPEIWETIEGALTTQGAIMVACGNASSTSGKFADIWGRLKKYWDTFQIDGREAMMTDKNLIDQWAETYGEDSDFFRVRVKGMPPKQGAKSLISREKALEAQARDIKDSHVNPSAPLIMGVDIARQGGCDNVILLRKGPKVSKDMRIFQERDLMKTAGIIAHQINTYRPDVCFIDAVGMGAGVLDRLIQMGHDCVVGVHAGDSPDEKEVFFNRRIEMWYRMAEWIPTADLPQNDRLIDELTAPEFYFDAKSKMRLESKDEMERRGVPSPDIADALALTFAYAVPVRQQDDHALVEPEVV